jgi:hypothetical protein
MRATSKENSAIAHLLAEATHAGRIVEINFDDYRKKILTPGVVDRFETIYNTKFETCMSH